VAWNVSFLVWALAYTHLETKLESGGSPQAGQDRQVERRETEQCGHRRAGMPRAHRR
jgi:hypothetical protein